MRPIDAELLKHTMERLIWEEETIYNGSPKSWAEEIKNFKDLIDGMPTIEVKPVVRAQWKKPNYIDMYYSEAICSSCGKKILDEHKKEYKYCPYCGAQMDEEV